MTYQDGVDLIDENNRITINALMKVRSSYADNMRTIMLTCQKKGMSQAEVKRLGTYIEKSLISWPWQPEGKV